MYKIYLLFVIAITVAGFAKASSLEERQDARVVYRFCRVFKGPDQTGDYVDIRAYVPDLIGYGIDDEIESVNQSGMWMFYENSDYNILEGKVYFVHGINISVTFPPEYANIVTAIRYAGDAAITNGDSITLYDGLFFTGEQYFSTVDASSINILDLAASSFIVTGLSPWTLYSETSYGGSSICVYPDTDHDSSPAGNLDFGIYPDITSIGVPDNAIRSIRKGCFADKTAKSVPMKVEGRAKNGAWGYFEL